MVCQEETTSTRILIKGRNGFLQKEPKVLWVIWRKGWKKKLKADKSSNERCGIAQGELVYC